MTTLKIIVFPALLTLLLSHSYAWGDTTSPNDEDLTYEVSLAHGVSHEHFHWTINGSPEPNILSELYWRNIETHQTSLQLDLHKRKLLLRLEASYGAIYDGSNQDSDYHNNNRQNEFSRSYSDISGETIDINAALGYPLALQQLPNITLTPMLGLSRFEQRLGMHNGTKVIDYDGNNYLSVNTPMTGLDSSYDTNWDTKWLGGDIHWQANPKLSFTLNYQYHYDIDYYAKANWNLRTNFQHPLSFTHKAERGEGHLVALTSKIKINAKLHLSIQYSYFIIEATDGIDLTFYTNNTSQATGLNIAETKSNTLLLGLSWQP